MEERFEAKIKMVVLVLDFGFVCVCVYVCVCVCVCVCFFFFGPSCFGFVCVLSLFVFWDFAQTVLGLFVCFFFFLNADFYIFLDLWVWFRRGFNVDCVGIFCAKIDFEWVSQLDLSWFGEEHEEWSSCSGLEVSGFHIFLGWRFDDFSGLIFSCGFGFDDFFMFWRFRWGIGILYEILHCFGFDVLLF